MKDKVVVLYIRLSKTDDDVELKGESDSVKNQRTLLHQHLDKHPDLAHFPRYEAVDDGYSGTNDNRPKLQEVLRMAENGEVQAICVKDNSRFFRNYIKAGEYLDIKFPMWGVRFLSVTDGYDSDNFKGMTADMEQALKNIIYASYPKMLSQATTSAKISLMKQGKFVGGYAPYGYRLDPSKRHTLFIDSEAASIVRMIFQKAIEGNRISVIVGELNLAQVETMSQYFKRICPDTKKFNFVSNDNCWYYAAVHKILRNQVYTGTLVGHKRRVKELGARKTALNEPIIVENTHEAIVSKEEFELAQRVIKKIEDVAIAKKEKLENPLPLWGMVRCGCCHNTLRKIKRKTMPTYYKCILHTRDASACSLKIQFPLEKLEEIVYQEIGDYIVSLKKTFPLETEQKIDKYSQKSKAKKYGSFENSIAKLKKQKLFLYEKYSFGKLNKEEYLMRKFELDREIESLEIKAVESELEEPHQSIIENIPDHQLARIHLYEQSEKLSSSLAKKFIKAVYINDENKVNIEFLN